MQQFCTNCGQPHTPGTAFCNNCGTKVGAGAPPAGTPFQPGGQPGYVPLYAQAPAQSQDDLLLAGLAFGSGVGRRRQRRQRRPRRPGSRLRGCGCLLLIIAVLVGPFIGLALTKGATHQIFIYAAVGMAIFLILVLLIAMLATKGGREALTEGIFEAILNGLFGRG